MHETSAAGAALVPASAAETRARPALDRADAGLEELVRAELVRAVYDQTSVALFANVSVASLLVLVYWETFPSAALLGWWIGIFGLSGIRFWSQRQYELEQPEPGRTEPWARRLIIGSVASGILWGAAAWCFSLPSIQYQLLLYFAISGMAAGATTSLNAFPPAFVGFLVPSLAPLAARLLGASEPHFQIMGIVTGVFMVCLLLIGRRSHIWLARSHRLRFQNERLARKLERARQHLRRANELLEARVARRTLELQKIQRAHAETERELRHSQRMEALGELTRGVAHDFNNLLTVVVGSLELVRARHSEDGEVQELVQRATSATSRGAELTRSLLAFARTQELHPQLLDPNELIRHSVDELLVHALGERVQIETHLDPDLWAIHADRTQLETALVNLAVNSRDAMPDGGTLAIETANVPEGRAIGPDAAGEITHRDVVRIRVRDTGCGIPRQLSHRVFEPFFSTKGPGRGSGLGLSMVYGFVRQSGGTVRLQSEEGEGCTFLLDFPARVGERPRSVPAAAPASQPKPLASGGGTTVLVVEDEIRVRELTVRMLQSLDYRTLEAPDADAALELLRSSEDVRLLLSDVVMPGPVDGIKLAEQARVLRPGLAVVLMSGYSEGLPIGSGTLLLHKPYAVAELAAAIREALDRAAREAAPAEPDRSEDPADLPSAAPEESAGSSPAPDDRH